MNDTSVTIFAHAPEGVFKISTLPVSGWTYVSLKIGGCLISGAGETIDSVAIDFAHALTHAREGARYAIEVIPAFMKADAKQNNDLCDWCGHRRALHRESCQDRYRDGAYTESCKCPGFAEPLR